MKKNRILVVEDDGLIAYHLTEILLKNNYIAKAVSNGEKALEFLKESEVDLILMDILLSGEMDGVQSVNKIRSIYDLPVVYLSAFSDDELLERVKKSKPYSYLTKPVKERELIISIEMALYKHEIDKKLREHERWMDATLCSIGDAVISTDLNSKITFMNKIAENITGWNLADAKNKDIDLIFKITPDMDYFENGTVPSVENPIHKALKNGKIYGLANHTILISKNNKRIPIDDSAAPIKDENGKIYGVVLVFRNVTEKKRVELELKKHKENLEILIKERTIELERKNKDLEEMNQIFYGRERRIKELREKVEQLEKEKRKL